MTEDTPLTALCAICHVGTLKYTCPRCSIHTCSLPCVKLHKARASCSGIRDPTTYRKRSNLATASSIDSDFNFITSLERSLARTTDESTRDGDIQAAGLSRLRQTDSGRLSRLVRDRGVTWRRAPEGMRRRQENESRVEHSGVTWTLEFILPDGSRKVCSSPDTSTIEAALDFALRPPLRHPGKRKRNPRAAIEEDLARDHEHTAGVDSPHENAAPKEAPTQKGGNGDEQYPKTSAARSLQVTAEGTTQPGPGPYADQHIYLFRPNTPSKLKVLKPLQRSDKLIDILQGRVVMEFPTLYVKTEPPGALPAPFMTEETYLRDYGEDVAPLAGSEPGAATDPAAAERDEGGGNDDDDEPGEEGQIAAEVSQGDDLKRDTEEMLRALADPTKVLSVLEQDLTS